MVASIIVSIILLLLMGGLAFGVVILNLFDGGMCTCSERWRNEEKVIYVSGKITVTSDYVARFSTVEDKLIAEGYEVLNPVREGKRLERCLETEKPTWVQYMKYAIATMMKADYIYMMSGWKQSKGARLEHFLARALNYNIIYEELLIGQTKKKQKNGLTKDT